MTLAEPEGCCCRSGEAMCMDCMKGAHITCYRERMAEWLSQPTLEQRVARLERMALNTPTPQADTPEKKG